MANPKYESREHPVKHSVVGENDRNPTANVVHGRAYCYRCMRVEAVCLCDAIVPVHNRTKLHILRHPRERRHAFNTVDLLELGLTEIRVYELGSDRGPLGFVKPASFPEHAVTLYPGPGSRDLADYVSIPYAERPAIVLLDGTWHHAHRMCRDNPWIGELPRFHLRPTQPGRFQIRAEPRRECLSTLEAAVMALRALDPDVEGLDGLLDVFELMNERQLEILRKNRGKGHHRFRRQK